MEAIDKIEKFLAVSFGDGDGDGSGDGYGSGYGDGSGDGYGDGDGSGYGYGDGSGDGDGYGSGDGYGDGDGSGYGVKSINGERVWIVDGVQTLIDSVHGSYARGRILRNDLTLQPCYIARVDNSFAHGETLRKAFDDAREKALEDLPTEERIKRFREHFTDFNKPYPTADFYQWHHILTGSCEMGRKNWCEEHGIDMDGMYTVRQFIELTKDSYGGNVIKLL